MSSALMSADRAETIRHFLSGDAVRSREEDRAVKRDSVVPKWEDLPIVLTMSEFAAVCRLGRNGAYEAVRRGEVPSLRIGRRLLIPKVGLQKMLEEAGAR